MPEPPSAGEPPICLMDSSRRDRHLSVDVLPSEKAEVVKLAAESGLSVADWLRAVVSTAIQRKAVFTVTYTETTTNLPS